jgi:hypothetical protein
MIPDFERVEQVNPWTSSDGGGVCAARDGVAGWESSSSVHCRFRFIEGEEAAEPFVPS